MSQYTPLTQLPPTAGYKAEIEPVLVYCQIFQSLHASGVFGQPET